jgi:hypothetical protein
MTTNDIIREIRLTNNGRLRRVAMTPEQIKAADVAVAAGEISKHVDLSNAALRCPSNDFTCYTERAS